MFDWNSKTKYEGTYVGHNFVFRLAKDERIVVDSIALQPTRVIDCPGLKNQVVAGSAGEGVAIITPLMQPEQDAMLSKLMYGNANATQVPAMNSTEWQAPDAAISPSARRRRARASGRTAGAYAQSF